LVFDKEQGEIGGEVVVHYQESRAELRHQRQIFAILLIINTNLKALVCSSQTGAFNFVTNRA
jgi:hypothetical protein